MIVKINIEIYKNYKINRINKIHKKICGFK